MQISNNFFISLFPLWILVLTTGIMMIMISWKRNHFINFIFSVISLILIFIYNIFVKKPFDVFSLLRIDKLSTLYTNLIIISSLITCIYSFNWLNTKKYKEEFYILLLISTLGSYILVNSNHMIALFLGIELTTIPIFGLVGYILDKNNSLEATIKYFILSSVTSLFFLLGISFLYTSLGNLNFSFIYKIKDNNFLHPLFLVGMSCIMVSIGFKLSLFPFHFWTPDLYQESPTTVSYFISSITKISVFYIVAKFCISIQDFSKLFNISLSIFAIFSILFGNMMAVIQKNIKRLLAYSSISHLGYMIIIIISKSSESLLLETLTISLISYLLSNTTIFGTIQLLSYKEKIKNCDSVKSYFGLFWNFPFLSFSLIISILSLSGIPITLGFISKFYILIMSLSKNLWWLVLITIIGSIIGIYYYFRIISILFIKKKSKFSLIEKNSCNYFIKIIIFISSFLIIILGILPNFLFYFIQFFLN